MPDREPIVRFEDHVGELELTIEAATLEDVFAEAARVVGREAGEPEGEAGPWEEVLVSARDAGTLLVDWLNEMIGRSEVENRAYGEIGALSLEEAAGRFVLRAKVRGRPVGTWESPLKAATYHGLALERSAAGGWSARVLIDV